MNAKMIEKMMLKIAGTDTGTARVEVEISDSVSESLRWVASIVADDGEVVTLESDWETKLTARGASVDEAMFRLDAICALDWAR